MAETILDWEARRDSNGNLRVYYLPANDGGGSYEVAGLNERYHPSAAAKLRELIHAKEFGKAENVARNTIADYTEPAKDWTNDPAVELFLRDCYFNRGPGGAAKILQMALGVKVDGAVGPITKAAVKKYSGRTILLLAKLRVAREQYENVVAPNRPNLRAGLENRWDNAFERALEVEYSGMAA